ncbi:MAG: glycosyltransferase [Oscillospiraceae bacterium]|nr:glycosyltransferase [Oscillospiraceae bacterium]
MKLSIIVPVYNVEKYLGACVDSLLAQTVEDYEIILVDDGSTDASGKIADAYADANPARIRVLHIENGGQGRARNFALEIARGRFVGFVDSDDWITPDMYEKLCTKAEETEADVVVCDFLEHYADGTEKVLPAAFQDHPLSSAGSSCNKIFRRDRIGALRFPEGLWYEDFYFSAVMLVRSVKTVFIHEPLYIYRRGQPSTMHNNNAAKNLDMLQIMDMIEQELIPAGRRDDFEFFVVNHVILDSISRLARQDSPDKKEVLQHFRDYAQVKIPRLLACKSFQRESRNRRIIMFLNYHGLAGLSQTILKLNAGMQKKA